MLKTKTKVKISLASASLAAFAFLFVYCLPNSSAETCTSSPCNTTFQVNVKESLTVAITADDTENTGVAGDFLRNKVNVKVVTNSPNGFSASMYPANSSLVNAVNSTKTIPTWTTSQTYDCAGTTNCDNFPSNKWGYSLDDNASHDGIYNPMSGTSSTPTALFNSNSGTDNKDVYFGTKTDMTQASGTYLGTVVINAVTGVVDPTTPTNPATPADDTPNDTVATYDSTNQRTVYTTTSTSDHVTTTTTQISDGDNTSMYPLGETYRSDNSEVNTGSSLASGLAIAASVAAASGAFFSVMAKRREQPDEESEE